MDSGPAAVRPEEEAMDVVVTVPKARWAEWLEEGDLAGDGPARFRSHFWIGNRAVPEIQIGERVYIVAYGRLRGYAPLVGVEKVCRLNPSRSCLMREGDAVAVTIPEEITGFMGWRYRWWDRSIEVPFQNWKRSGVPEIMQVEEQP